MDRQAAEFKWLGGYPVRGGHSGAVRGGPRHDESQDMQLKLFGMENTVMVYYREVRKQVR